MRLTDTQARRVKEAILKLQENLRIHGTIRLERAPIAQYRYRVGDHRILFDINDEEQIIGILDIRRRSERTYK